MAARRPLAVTVRHPRLRVDRKAIGAAIRVLDANAAALNGGCPAGELSLVFMTDAELAQLHGAFLGDPSPTDVITFSGDAAAGTAGEVCVSADAALREAGRAAAALSAELTLYVVHGWLHLAGYDDLRPVAKRAMRRAEARSLRLLAEAGAIPRFVLA
jgi:probable rRNA maturation factor